MLPLVDEARVRAGCEVVQEDATVDLRDVVTWCFVAHDARRARRGGVEIAVEPEVARAK